MNITIAQIKLRTADFEHNYNKIISVLEKTEKSDLIIFPQNTLTGEGCKDLLKDSLFIETQQLYFQKLLAKKYLASFLVHVGNQYILIKNAQVFPFKDMFNLNKIIVSPKLVDVNCDVFVWAQNIPFSLNSNILQRAKDFVLKNNCQLIYLNAFSMADENIYAGESFSVNKDGQVGFKLPICDEKSEDLVDAQASSGLEFFSQNELSINRASLPVCEEQMIFKVLSFALKEYCRINGFKKVATGLSGGIDSALTMAIATSAIGRVNVLGLIMPSQYSSEGSIEDSLRLAQNLGINTDTVGIEPVFDKFMDNIAKARIQDVAEENLQARLRGLIVMFYSNRENYLALVNGNKSEIAVGYSTLYGDMAGGLNLICDLTKQRVYKLAKWINRDGEIIPKSIIEKPPSAELRPNQKDQDYLPEYKVLDDIIEMYIEQNLPLAEIYKKYNKNLVDDMIRKIAKAQYKRKQACLGVKLTNRAFCSNVNLPIIQGLR